MKIQLFIMTFLLMFAPSFGQTYSVVKGSVYGVAVQYDVIQRDNSKVSATIFDKGTQLQLKEDCGICTLKDKGRAHLFFSNKMHVWLGGTTTLWIDNFEQFVDKDENGKTIVDEGSFVANFRLNGSADFKLKGIADTGYFCIMTNGASLEIKSKHFYVTTYKNTTNVECYEGTISFVNSDTMKETVLTAGNAASVFGREGNMNTIVDITPLSDEKKAAAKARLTELAEPEWVFLSSPKTP